MLAPASATSLMQSITALEEDLVTVSGKVPGLGLGSGFRVRVSF